MAGNFERLGLPDHPHEWTLEGRPKKGRGGKDDEAAPLVRKCSACDVMVPIALPTCPHCGEAQQAASGAGRKVEEIAGELREIDREQVRRERLKEQSDAQSLEDLVELGKSRGHKGSLKWGCHVYVSRLRRRGDQWQSQLLDELVQFGRKQGYKNPQAWASHLFTETLQKQNQAG